jgi:hypothetical protein
LLLLLLLLQGSFEHLKSFALMTACWTWQPEGLPLLLPPLLPEHLPHHLAAYAYPAA